MGCGCVVRSWSAAQRRPRPVLRSLLGPAEPRRPTTPRDDDPGAALAAVNEPPTASGADAADLEKNLARGAAGAEIGMRTHAPDTPADGQPPGCQEDGGEGAGPAGRGGGGPGGAVQSRGAKAWPASGGPAKGLESESRGGDRVHGGLVEIMGGEGDATGTGQAT